MFFFDVFQFALPRLSDAAFMARLHSSDICIFAGWGKSNMSTLRLLHKVNEDSTIYSLKSLSAQFHSA